MLHAIALLRPTRAQQQMIKPLEFPPLVVQRFEHHVRHLLSVCISAHPTRYRSRFSIVIDPSILCLKLKHLAFAIYIVKVSSRQWLVRAALQHTQK